jgi:hypothetical protein
MRSNSIDAKHILEFFHADAEIKVVGVGIIYQFCHYVFKCQHCCGLA